MQPCFFLPLLQTRNIKITNELLIFLQVLLVSLSLKIPTLLMYTVWHTNWHQEILTDLFYYFKASSKRAAKIKQVQEILQDPILTYKELHSVRWLSYFNALTAVFRTLDSLLTYLGEAGTGNKDPKAVGLKRKVSL